MGTKHTHATHKYMQAKHSFAKREIKKNRGNVLGKLEGWEWGDGVDQNICMCEILKQ